MRRIAICLLCALALACPGLTSAEPLTSGNLSRPVADSLAGVRCREALLAYAASLEQDWAAGRLRSGEYQMPFVYYVHGDRPETGYPLYISLHGGGEAEAEVNDQQWENQKRLYGDVEGIYFVPRAPTNSWDMWHQSYMDDFLCQIVNFAIVNLGVDFRRIYILGYSAGGDGVYNLASRLSDRFAAAAMMAGHPGDAQIENLRNLPFALYVGENDTAYNRAGLVVEWLRAYQRLNGEDPDGFNYNINIYEGKGHWMDGLDGAAIGWLANYSRVANPSRVIWVQDDVLHTRKYNLEVREPEPGYRVEQRVDVQNNTIYIFSEHYREVTIWLDDYILDLDKPVVVIFNGREVFRDMVLRSEGNIAESIQGRLDHFYVYWGRVTVARP